MARGEGSIDGERNAGLIIGVVLGTFALAALLVVVYVYLDGEESPVGRTTMRIGEAHVSAPLCDTSSWGTTEEEGRLIIDRELRLRGYVAADEWLDDQVIGEMSAEPIQGACGVVVALARTGSDVGAMRIDGQELHGCRSNMGVIASCGEPVRFLGTGVASVRNYVMPGVGDAPAALHTAHRLLHAEAEHSLARVRLNPAPRVFAGRLSVGDSIEIVAPEDGCVHYVASAMGRGAIVPTGTYTGGISDISVVALTLCVGDPPSLIQSGATEATFAVRRFTEARGVGVPATVASQISDAEIVSNFEDL